MARKNQKSLEESRKAISSIPIGDSDFYKSLGLRFNPFPAGGMAPSNPQIEPYPDTRVQIIDFFRKFLQNQSARGLVLMGTYGAGKTYHLNYIHAILQEAAAAIRIIHVTDPGIDPYQIIRAILLNIGEEEIGNMVWNLVGGYFRQQLTNDPHYFLQFVHPSTNKKTGSGSSFLFNDAINPTDEDWADYRKFFRVIDKFHAIDRDKLLANLVQKLTSPNQEGFLTVQPKVAEDLISLCVYEDVPALGRWKGMTEGIGAGAIKSGNEADFLQALIGLFNRNGLQYFVLLLDEFEKVSQIERLTARETKRYLETVRVLIDTAQDDIPFTYVIATNEAAWLEIINLEQSLAGRFYIINLKTTTEDSVAEYLVKSYIELALPKDKGIQGLGPFPADFLERIPLQLRNTPRQLVRLCHELIETAAKTRQTNVNQEIIEQVVANTNYFGGLLDLDGIGNA